MKGYVRWLWLLAVVILAAGAYAGVTLWSAAGVLVTVTVDGYREEVRSTRPDVGRLLADLGLALRPEDRLQPPAETPLTAGLSIEIRRARPILIAADGVTLRRYSHVTEVGAALDEAGIRLAPYDEVWLDGLGQTSLTAALPQPARDQRPPRFARGRAWAGQESQPVRLAIRRAVPLTVDDGSVPFTIYTTAATIGEALLRAQVTLYLGDRVQPSLGSRMRPGQRVVIERSRPVLVTADRRTVHTRTRGKTVGDALLELGILTSGSDKVTPALSQPALDNLQIRVVRVVDSTLVQGEPIPFESILVADDQLEIDQQRLDQRGASGEHRRRFAVVYEDGEETLRLLTDDWVAAEPITQVVAYGRKIVSRVLETPEGTFSYWRKVRMLATSYSASTAGTSPAASYYGLTRLGWPMRKGIVAVDPTMVVLGSRVYVPGYGPGDAADTGSAIRSRRIDLGYDDDNLVLWYNWVDVYLLDPPPPRSQIRWVLPNWPIE